MRSLAVVIIAAAAWLAACGGPQLAPPVKAGVALGLPATLEATRPKTGDPRPLHVRVYVDAQARALPHWKEELTDQLDYVAQLLQPMFGVRFTVDATTDWDHSGGDVHPALDALAALDPDRPGDGSGDATWVIGVIGPDPTVATASKAFEQLGAANVLGRHVVIRAWAERPELAALAPELPEVDSPQHAEVVAAHKRHKQAVVLLHELAITLGAIDEADPTWIQHPLYSSKMSTFSDRNRDLMQLALDQRLGAGTDQTLAHDLLEAIDKQEWGGWVPQSHDEVTKILRNVLDSAKAGKTAADVPPAAYDQFDHVRELLKAHDFGPALAQLEGLIAAYPANATLLETRCELMLGRATEPPAPPRPTKGAPAPPVPAAPLSIDKKTRDACARAAEMAQGDPTPHLAVGEALAATGDVLGARAELVLAAGKIANLPTGQAAVWSRLVGIYVAMSALTWAEEAFAAGGLAADPQLAPQIAEVAKLRARFGAPKGLFPPEREGAAVRAAREAMEAVGSTKPAEAERVVAAAERKFPRAPGILTARCNLDMSTGAVEPAKAACAAALAKAPDDSYALYLAAILEFRDTSAGATRAGIDKLKRAIAADPELGQAWRALAKAYDRAHDDAARAELAKQYQAKFGQAL